MPKTDQTWSDDPVTVALLDAGLWCVEAAHRNSSRHSTSRSVVEAITAACAALKTAEDDLLDLDAETARLERGGC